MRTWSATGDPVAVQLVTREETRTDATVYCRAFHTRERWARAAGGLGACWALAVVTVLVPIAHFVLVPGFLLIGPFVAWRRFLADRVVLGGLGTCPRCTKPLRVPRTVETWPFAASCDACRAILEVRKAAA